MIEILFIQLLLFGVCRYIWDVLDRIDDTYLGYIPSGTYEIHFVSDHDDKFIRSYIS